MPVYTLEAKQKFPVSKEVLWEFISTPANLKLITPESMNFEIISENLTARVFKGMLIEYRVSPLFGIKLNCVTEIPEVREYEFFIDEQRRGPYKYWHHEHILEEIDSGVLMTDIVKYKPPFAFIGSIANSIIISSKLRGILEFRRKKLAELFGEY